MRTFEEYCALESRQRHSRRFDRMEELHFEREDYPEELDATWHEASEYDYDREVEAILKRPVDVEELATLV